MGTALEGREGWEVDAGSVEQNNNALGNLQEGLKLYRIFNVEHFVFTTWLIVAFD